ILAFVISYMLGPLVNYLERAGVDRVLATSAVFILVGFALGFSISALTPLLTAQLSSLKSELPKYIEGVTLLISETEEKFELLSGSLYSVDISGRVEEFLVSSTTRLFE